MLLSGGFGTKPKKDERKEKKNERDEKYEIQENVFIRWASTLLADPPNDYKDLTEPHYPLVLLNVLTGKNLSESGTRYDDFTTILNELGDMKMTAVELVESQPKAVLSLWWALVQLFWRKAAPDPIRHDKMQEALRHWCVEVCKEYPEVSVSDFTSSWRDGYAFNVLLHNFDSKLVNISKLAEMSAIDRIEYAFSTAEKQLQVPRLLVSKELHSEHLDTRSVVIYLMTLYLSLLERSKKYTVEQETLNIATESNKEDMHASSQQQSVPSQPSDESHVGNYDTEEPTTHQTIQLQEPTVQQTLALPLQLAESPTRKSFTEKAKQQQSLDNPNDLEVSIRSRKSSSSSQKSSRSRKARKEELVKEFDQCLEQVLAWLLEAEEEIGVLSDVEMDDVSSVKTQFREYEKFMASLTESQDTVGRVLHRGQILCQKAESDEERQSIQNQLMLVNSRWEELRALAMDRQALLQSQLTNLQQRQLNEICEWLADTETLISSCGPLANTSQAALKQISDHERLQKRINDYQNTVGQLSSFVAVIDENDGVNVSVTHLEQTLHSVGERWESICQWAEHRASQLDGLAELLDQTETVFERLNDWLKQREHELLGLRSAHHLEDPEQVADQVRKLQKAESSLEAEHGSFIKLSQLSCELVSRLDSTNGAAANDVRRRLDTITQRWDNLVTRIEEHSHTLVRSGKADLKQLKERPPDKVQSMEELPPEKKKKRDEALTLSTVQFTTVEEVPSYAERLADQEKEGNTTETDVDEPGNEIVDLFLRHIRKLEVEMEPLHEWCDHFSLSRKPAEVRKMIAVCRDKLIEIKDQEAKVNRLQLELERIHMNSQLNSRQLKKANDSFEEFAKGWAKIVTKISEALNVLTGHADDSEEAAIGRGIEEWIEGCDMVLGDMKRLQPSDRVLRAEKLKKQLVDQRENLAFLDKDPVKKAILGKGLDIVGKKIEQHIGEIEIPSEVPQSTIMVISHVPLSSLKGEAEAELNGEWCTVGDLPGLESDITRCQNIIERGKNGALPVDLVERAETRKAETQERRKTTKLVSEKLNASEDTLKRLTIAVQEVVSSEEDFSKCLSSLNSLREENAVLVAANKDAEKAVEKMLSTDERITEETCSNWRTHVDRLSTECAELFQAIEDNISCIKKEQKKCVQKAITDGDRVLENLEKAIEESENAADAEELSEHLDHLESLLEKVPETENLEGVVKDLDESFVRDNWTRHSESVEKISSRAKERVEELNKRVHDCERFERMISDLQHWAGPFSQVLLLRKNADISALDLPEEYKKYFESGNLLPEMQREFEAQGAALTEMRKFVSDPKHLSNDRLKEQLDHVERTYSDVSSRFAAFKQPVRFEVRLEKTTQKLSEIENEIDDLTGIKAELLSDGLAQAQHAVKELISIDAELLALEDGRAKLLKDGILGAEESSTVMEKIHFAKKKTKELGQRAEGAVDRLDDCQNILAKMIEAKVETDSVLSLIESRLDAYAAEQSTSTVDDGQIEQLMNEWNRNESVVHSLDQLCRILRGNAVYVDGGLYEERRHRADELKTRLDGWNATLQEMNDDEDTLLLEVDELHSTLIQKLKDIEMKQDPRQIATCLRFLRNDRDRLSSRARRLATKNPRMCDLEMINDINKRWSDLENRLDSSLPEPPVLPPNVVDDVTFELRVQKMSDRFQLATRQIDFDSYPVRNAKEWKQRVQALEKWLCTERDILADVMNEGRQLANSGRMELETHRAIEKLDDVIDVANELELEVERHRSEADIAKEKEESLRRDVSSLMEVLSSLRSRNLNDPEIVQATQRDLSDRDSQLCSLSRRAAELHAVLPGRSSASRDHTLDCLNNCLEELEKSLAQGIKNKEMSAAHSPSSKRASAASPDRSISSMGLAMEVHGTENSVTTEDEGISNNEMPLNHEEVIEPMQKEFQKVFKHNEMQEKCASKEEISSTNALFPSGDLPPQSLPLPDRKPSLPAKLLQTFQKTPTMENVFIILDNIEDQIAFDDEFPMENLNDAAKRYKKMAAELDSCVRAVQANQMTLDMYEAECTLERIEVLRKDLEERKRKSNEDKSEWIEFEKDRLRKENRLMLRMSQCLIDAEKVLTSGLSLQSASVRKTSRSQKMETQKENEMQLKLEEMVRQCETVLCDAVRRAGVLLPRLREGGLREHTTRQKLEDIEEKFRDWTHKVRSSRAQLEAQSVDLSELRQGIENLEFWCDETAVETQSKMNWTDKKAVDAQMMILENRLTEISAKRSLLSQFELSKDRVVALPDIDQNIKHETRRMLSNIAKKLANTRSDLSDRLRSLAEMRAKANIFWADVEKFDGEANEIDRRVSATRDAVIYTPSREHIDRVKNDASSLRSRAIVIEREAVTADSDLPPMSDEDRTHISTVIAHCLSATDAAEALRYDLSGSNIESSEIEMSLSTVVEVTEKSDVTGDVRTDSATSHGTIQGSDRVESIHDEVHTSEESADDDIVDNTVSKISMTETLKSDPVLPEPSYCQRDQVALNSLTQMRHWLTEIERDAGLTVDLANSQQVKDTLNNLQIVIDQLRQRFHEPISISDGTQAPIVKQKAAELTADLQRVLAACQKRKCQLNRMAEQSRTFDRLRSNCELWLAQAEGSLGEKPAIETGDEAIRVELLAVEDLIGQLDEQKEKIQELNSKGNALLDEFPRDEAHSLSHLLSKINMSWSKFNDNVRIRRAVLEASLRSRSDFNSALGEMEEWIDRVGTQIEKLDRKTNNSQALKDTQRRREWIQEQKNANHEIDAHSDVLRSVEDMGQKILGGLEPGKEKQEMDLRMQVLRTKWNAIGELVDGIRTRLEGAEQQWEKLTNGLSELINWIEQRSKQLLDQQPIGGCLSSVLSQGAFVKNVERDMESRNPQIKEIISKAHSYLMQHDLRPKMFAPGVLENEEEMLNGSEMDQRRYGLQIHADCEKLKEKWAELGIQAENWSKVVASAAQKLQELERALAECQLHLSSVEQELEGARAVENLRLEELKGARSEVEGMAGKVDELRVHLDDANDACGKILAADMPLDQHPRNQLDAVNQRFHALKTMVRVRAAALRNALTDFGPSSEHFLNNSVSLPWQRAISKTNHLPYYIDHNTEQTQWEHPVWVEMSKELNTFNRVKFIAYRTAMKLRALQKRLCLDLVSLPMLEKAFARLEGLSNEESPGLEGMVCTLLPLFETLHSQHPQLVRSVALAVDLCINFLLNLYDPSRDGILRVLSFKVALITFCNATLEDKYRALFSLIVQDSQSDQKHVALLFYDLIHIPKLVGEAAAFGGSNVEPSVRSCFETVRLSSHIQVGSFLDWLKKEPQSLVWLPVMHRLSTAEFSKHQAKCNVCKMFPVVGLRYRCLRCFNFDMCQNCFFSQRTSKNHKLKHPMQEYSIPTTSGEDVRDFAYMVRNKLGRRKKSIGYLPVEVGEEGKPLACSPPAAHNPHTEAVHQRISACAERLYQLTQAEPAEPPNEMMTISDLKSPLQLINQVDQMQKDELDQLLQRLQLENIELKKELEKRKSAAASTPDLDRIGLSGTIPRVRESKDGARSGTLPRLGTSHGRSVPSLQSAKSTGDVVDDARALRIHKQRLEHRSRILEQQNSQLEMQLQRLKKMIDTRDSSSRVPSISAEREWTIERAQRERASIPQKNGEGLDYISPINGHGAVVVGSGAANGWDSEGEGDRADNQRTNRMNSLLATVDDLGRAMESLVVSVVYDSDEDRD